MFCKGTRCTLDREERTGPPGISQRRSKNNIKMYCKGQDLRTRTAFIWLGREQERAFGFTLVKPWARYDPENFFTGLECIRFPRKTAAISCLVSYKMSSFKTKHSNNQSSPWTSSTCSNATRLSYVAPDISNLSWSIKTCKEAFTGEKVKDGIMRKAKGLFVVT